MATRRRRATLVLLALGFVFILVEGTLQLACLVSPTVRWQLNPLRAGFIEDGERGRRGDPDNPRHDAWGYSNETVPDRADVVVIGDSQTYGTSVQRGQAWPELAAAASGRTVYNMGLPGAGPVQHALALEQALSLGPELLVLGAYLGNDLVDAYRYTYAEPLEHPLVDPGGADRIAAAEAEERLMDRALELFMGANGRRTPGVYDWFVAHVVSRVRTLGLFAAVVREIGTALKATPLQGDAAWARQVELAGTRAGYVSVFEASASAGGVARRTIFTGPYRAIAMDLKDPRIAEGLSMLIRLVTTMRERCATQGCEVIVMDIPTKELVFAPLVDDPAAHAGLVEQLAHETDARRQLRQRVEAQGLVYWDALPSLQAALQSTGPAPYDESPNGHPNVPGNAALGAWASTLLR